MEDNITKIARAVQRRIKHDTEPPDLPTSITIDEAPVQTVRIEDIESSVAVSPGDHVVIAVESVATSPDPGSALLELAFESADGNRLPIPGWPHYSRRVGEYRYLTPGDPKAPAQDEFQVTAPDAAVNLVVRGHRWKQAVNTSVLGAVVINVAGRGDWTTQMPSGLPLAYSAAQLDVVHQIDPPGQPLTIRISFRAGQKSGNSPLAVELLGSHGELLLPYDSLQQSPQLGPYISLSSDDSIPVQVSETIITPPKEASSIRIRGRYWGNKTAEIIGPIEIEPVNEHVISAATTDTRDPFDAFIEGQYSKPFFIIDTTAPPLGHETLSLRPNNLAPAYARRGIGVLFVPFGTLQDHPEDVADGLYQVSRERFGDVIGSLVRSRAHDPGNSWYICSSFPSIQSISTATLLKSHGWNVAYEARDDMEEFNRVGYSTWYSPQLERKMLSLADVIISVSEALDRKLRIMSPHTAPQAVVPNGLRQELIESTVSLRTDEVRVHRNEARVVGYVGHLTPSWFDWPLVIAAARALPGIRFDIIGHGMPDNLTLPSNVIALGPRTHDEIGEIARDWKVGLIPFLNVPLTRSVDPNKIYEYFAWGLRCVSAHMGIVDTYPSTYVYSDQRSFIEKLRIAVDDPMSGEELARMSEFLLTCDWDTRARQSAEVLQSLRERADA